MARKNSLWSELQRERDRRARIALARQREERQLVRQLRQDSERAQGWLTGRTLRSASAGSSRRTRPERLRRER